MNGRMKSLLLVILLLNVSNAVGDDGASTMPTMASQTAMSIAAQRQDLVLARRIINDCERLVETMKEYEQLGHVKKGDPWQTFVQKHQPTINQLIRDGRRLEQSDLSAAGQLPKVANVVLIALGFEGNNAFETMLQIFEQDRDKATLRVRERECRLPRTWSNRSGSQTVVAELISHDATTVVLRRLDTGREVTVVIDKLSDVDRSFLDQIADVGSFGDRQVLKEIGIERRALLRDAD